MAQDYYELLGVSKSANDSEIKSAYRKKALEWHPDRNKSPEAESKFKEVTAAFEVLSDTQKRAQYDQFGHDNYTRQGPSGGATGGYSGGPFSYTYSSSGGGNPFEGFDTGGFSDPFDVFEQFFGFKNSAGRQARKPIYQLEIDFKDVIKGSTKTVSIGGKNKTIKIPAGVDSGMRMRLTDFDIQFIVRPDKNFERQGQDVISKVPLSFITAILGGVVEVTTLEGSTVKLKVKPATKPGTMMRLKDKGLPHVNSTKHGDHYVVFVIEFPEKLSRRQKELLEEFERES